MDKIIYKELDELIKSESEKIMLNENDIQKKVEKLDIWFNLKKIIDNYDELEPLLKTFFDEKAQKDKWER